METHKVASHAFSALALTVNLSASFEGRPILICYSFDPLEYFALFS